MHFSLRYASRQLIKSPGFTATAVLGLALGIGAVSGTLLLIAVSASWFPARRATRIDPVRALRME